MHIHCSLNQLYLLAALAISGCVTTPQPQTSTTILPDAAQSASTSDTKVLNVQPLPTVEIKASSLAALTTIAQQPVENTIDDGVWSRIRAGYGIPAVDATHYRRELDWYRQRQSFLSRASKRAQPYLHHLMAEIEKRGMPAELALLPVVESAFQPFAYSSGRASGIWQFIPATGKHYGLRQNWWYDGRRDIEESTRAALDYLSKLHKEFNGDWLLAVAAYNCGEGNVHRALRRYKGNAQSPDFWQIRKLLPRETRGYVPRLLAIAAVVSEPAHYGLKLGPIADEGYFQRVELDGQIDLALAANLAKISLDEIYRLNPGFNRWATDPDGPHRLLLPVEKVAEFQTALAAYPRDQRVNWRRHRIRSGETLGGIAHKYRTTATVLRQANRLRGNFIRAGRNLLIPVARKSLQSYKQSAERRRQRSIKSPRSGKREIYQVRKGDSLWSIARRKNLRISQISAWNGLNRGDPIRPGLRLTLWQTATPALNGVSAPTAGAERTGLTRQKLHYTVRRGDSLWRISNRFKVSIASLKSWNRLSGKHRLQPGQRIKLFVDVTRSGDNG